MIIAIPPATRIKFRVFKEQELFNTKHKSMRFYPFVQMVYILIDDYYWHQQVPLKCCEKGNFWVKHSS